MLQQQYQDDEQLPQKIVEMKEQLLDRLIDQKILLSVAKEKDYDLSNDIEVLIKQIKKEYGFKTDQDLRTAIASQGLDYEIWKQQMKDKRMQDRLIYEEIGTKINIDNSEIMAYYKANPDKFTKPAEFTLNCIYLDKANYPFENILEKKKEAILAELKEKKFEEVAATHSELPSTENKYFLGKFKQGELDAKLEEAALKLNKSETSATWLATETGLYILNLVEKTERGLIQFKEVRDQIHKHLRGEQEVGLVKEFIAKLKKESYIKIYEPYYKK
ncbi:MAG: hypothetical protein GY765_36085, partial [bacterium]|nr:hypothetical protein [bacterium]